MRDGGGGKKMERGKAHTVVGAAHHKDRGHLTWQRAPLASQLTREENSVRGRGIAHEREGIACGKGRNRAREAGNAFVGEWRRAGKNCGRPAFATVPACLQCFVVPILTLIGQIGSPIGHI